MINRIILLLFIGLAWGQDKYPYFKDMNKQLKFEQKKILVSYDKIYKITKNGKVITELDFLYSLGLKSQADSIKAINQKKIQDYLNPSIKTKQFDKDGYYTRKGMCYGIGTVLVFYSVILAKDKYYKQTSFIPACLGGFSILGGYLTNKSKYIIEVQEKKIIPYLDGFFTVAQVKGMTEAYNRKIFDEISNK